MMINVHTTIFITMIIMMCYWCYSTKRQEASSARLLGSEATPVPTRGAQKTTCKGARKGGKT